MAFVGCLVVFALVLSGVEQVDVLVAVRGHYFAAVHVVHGASDARLCHVFLQQGAQILLNTNSL